jgi:hypothetical protein
MLAEVVVNCEVKPNMVVMTETNMLWTDEGFQAYIQSLCHIFFEKYFMVEFKKYIPQSHAI